MDQFQKLQQAIRDQVLAVFAKLVDAIKEVRKATIEDFKKVNERIDSVSSEIEQKADEALYIARNTSKQKGDPGHTPTVDELTEIIEPLIPEPIPGNDYVLKPGDKEEIAGMIEVPIVKEKTIVREYRVTEVPVIKEVAVADSPENLRNKLETLEGDDRLDKAAVKGIDELENAIKQIAQDRPNATSNSRGVQVLVGGAKKGLLKMMNFTAGPGVTIGHSLVNGLDTITFTASGGGATAETPPETVQSDGSQLDFTVSGEPKYVIIDGRHSVDNFGYTYSSITGKITVSSDNPPTLFVIPYV